MNIITAPNTIYLDNISVFLAGGITNCHNWQNKVIDYLKEYDSKNKLNLTVYNPRRDNFDINKDDPIEQIKWEYNAINNCANIFSMYFCNSESDQPICMYELGMRLGRMISNLYNFLSLLNGTYSTIISVEDGYKRANNVIIQTKLACADAIKVHLHATPESHAKLIIDEYNSIKKKEKYNNEK